MRTLRPPSSVGSVGLRPPRDILIQGVAVDPHLLDPGPAGRCNPAECQARCCVGGASVRVPEAAAIRANAALVVPHLPPERRDPARWFDDEDAPGIDEDLPGGAPLVSTAVHPDATHPAGRSCVFLRPDRWCALQVTSSATGGALTLKPFYCALHPLVFERSRLILDEASPTVRGGGGCRQDAGEAPRRPIFRLFDT